MRTCMHHAGKRCWPAGPRRRRHASASRRSRRRRPRRWRHPPPPATPARTAATCMTNRRAARTKASSQERRGRPSRPIGPARNARCGRSWTSGRRRNSARYTRRPKRHSPPLAPNFSNSERYSSQRGGQANRFRRRGKRTHHKQSG